MCCADSTSCAAFISRHVASKLFDAITKSSSLSITDLSLSRAYDKNSARHFHQRVAASAPGRQKRPRFGRLATLPLLGAVALDGD
jgi:hypothetical protein